MRVRHAIAAAVLTLALAAACAGEPDRANAGGGAASRRIEASALARLPEWQLDSTLVVIGAREGSAPYLLHRAGLPQTLRSGRIVVPNNQTEIRWYDSTGAYIRTTGQKGQGPGDFVQLWNVHPIEGDTILATDASGRISVFDSAGRFVRSYAGPNADYPVGVHWLPDRSMVFSRGSERRQRLAPGDTGVVLDSILLLRLRAPDVPADTVARVKGWWRYLLPYKSYMTLRFSGAPLLAAGASGIVVAHGDEFTLRWFDTSGRPMRDIRVEVNPERVPGSMIEDFRAEVAASNRRIEQGGETAPNVRIPHAEHLPIITRVVMDRGGRTWVRRGASDEAPEAAWIVFDSTAMPLARVTTPAGFVVSDAGQDYVLGRFMDADGVLSVRKYRLVRTGHLSEAR